MSSQTISGHEPSRPESLGGWLRRLREERSMLLREAAAVMAIDPALLSKIELGRRFATEAQVAALAKAYGVPRETLEARRLAEKWKREDGASPAFPQATAIVSEEAGEYRVKKLPIAASKSPRPVNKRRKAR